MEAVDCLPAQNADVTSADVTSADVTSADVVSPSASEPPLSLESLENETLQILQKYGSPGAKNVTRLGPPVSAPSKRGASRPSTSLNRNRSCRTTGGLVKTANKDADARPFTSRSALRDTISSALSTSKFDNVPSLLASGHTNELQSSDDLRTSPFFHVTSPYQAPVKGGLNKSSTPKKKKLVVDVVDDKLFDPSKLKSLSLRDIKYTGFDDERPATTAGNTNSDPDNLHNEKEVCFNCWSAGCPDKCVITSDSASDSGQNLSMCKHWDAGLLRRKYRSEEIQEQFNQTSQSLVFDKELGYTTVDEPKHPIYRLLEQHIASLNFSYQRRQHVRTWFQSFIKKLKDGKYEGKRSNASAQILLLKGTIKNMMAVRKLSAEVKDQHPKAPVTGTTMRERLGQEQVLVEKVVNGGEKRNFVIVGPTPIPKALYRPRKYEPLPPVKFVLRNQTDLPDGRLDFGSIMSSSIQYATFGQKRSKENIAVGGLSAQMIVSQRFVGRFPPQYKNFTCSHDEVLVPPPVDENSPSFPTLEVPPGKLPYVRRELVTPLDSRLPPAVMVKTGLGPDDRHFFGVNRPEQTGEDGDFGFRTSTWCSLPDINDKIDTTQFRPSQSIATPNVPVLSPMRLMKVDGSYPFCEEQSRTNSVDDLYHLLLSDGACSSNKLQIFTVVGSQQAGYYMQNGDSSLPIGRVVTKIVRSWAFLQSESEEDAIYEEEETPLGLGGVVLKHRPRHAESMPGGVLMKNSRKDVRRAILRKMPPEEDCHVAISPTVTAAQRREAAAEVPVVSEGVRSTEKTSRAKEKAQRKMINNQSPSSDIGSPKRPIPIGHQPNISTPSQEGQKEDSFFAESISHVIGETLKSFSSKPEDLIRLGMGLGASLGAQGFLSLDSAGPKSPSSNEEVIAVPIQEDGEMSELEEGFDDITIKSCSSEESKVEPESPLAANGIERNLVNFSDFNSSPQGLLNVIASTRVASKRVEYLSYTFNLNLPSSQSIPPLKPSSMAEEWREINYNPWSAGRDPTSSTFIRSLAQEMKHWPKPRNRMDGPLASNTHEEFKALCTLCRHGKYRELEEMMNQKSFSLPIDYCDDSGNTLLMIACQNGNKRIAKLCLRRGSQINNQNLNGNSCLHFSFGYGFGDLGEYLISKGADDSLQNASGLTCYEFSADVFD